MSLKIHDSLQKKKVDFKPLKEGEVRMYVCGPTVYDEPHIGHLRSAYVFDVIRRYLEFKKYKVTFVRNVTDVDDKIIDKAAGLGGDLVAQTKAVSEKYLALYKEDLRKLGIQEPTIEPKATMHIPEMLALIETLIQKGFAYPSDGDVYFDVNAFKGYGKLSHQQKDAMMESVRIDKNEKKRDGLDFALWKNAKDGEPSWKSPWGPGRPGWHIECSAMSLKYLGEEFDIHGGGRDLIFPHHENEVAQSECATGKGFAKYWIHHGLITVDGGQKMSKSLKNFVTLKQVEQKSRAGVEELKFLFLGTHYGMPLDFSEEKMKMEKSIRDRFVNFLSDAGKGSESDKSLDVFEKSFVDAMDNDFNTPQALAVMHELVTHANKNAESKPAAAEKLRAFGKALGLDFSADTGADERRDKMIADFRTARNAKDFKQSDAIREAFHKAYGQYLSVDKEGSVTVRNG